MNTKLFWSGISEGQKQNLIVGPLREAAIRAIQFGIPIEQAVQLLKTEYSNLVSPPPPLPSDSKEKVTV